MNRRKFIKALVLSVAATGSRIGLGNQDSIFTLKGKRLDYSFHDEAANYLAEQIDKDLYEIMSGTYVKAQSRFLSGESNE